MFKRKQPQQEPEMTPTEYAAALRANAIEYIVSLKKADKDRFIEAVGLIWEGYQKLDTVKTENERAVAIERRKMGLGDDVDDLASSLIDDDMLQQPPVLPKGEA